MARIPGQRSNSKVEAVPDFQLAQQPLLSRTALEKAEELRRDTDALEAGWATAQILQVDHHGQARLDDASLVLVAAVNVSPQRLPDAVFLGIYENRHLWTLRVGALAGETGDLRSAGEKLDAPFVSMLTSALAILNWHSRAAFSAVDGSGTIASGGGWSRTSVSSGHEEFPRTDPAIICLVHDGADRVVLARAPAWPERRFSVLAGFVEAGESLESCVRREIKEEVGLDVTDIAYLGSQPWPFPRSVMIGFSARADEAQPLQFLDGEIAEAHWFDRAEVQQALELGDWASDSTSRLLLPGSISIARIMLEAWAAHDG